jgi:hypothetical protein
MKQNPDYDKETAKATCGKLKAQLEGKIPWQGTVKPVEGNRVAGQALHPIKTYHPGEWPELRVYLEDELKKSAETLSGKPFGIDHLSLLPQPNQITRAWWENDAINYEGQVDDTTAEMIRKGEIKGVSVEYDWDILQNVNGVAPKGIEFTSLHFLKNFEAGDPSAYAELLEAIIIKLKEAKQKNTTTTPNMVVVKEQTSAEPNEFIFYLVHDPAAFLEERFSTVWVDQTSGIQGVYGYLREQADQPQPMALLFMKANGWTPQKMMEWLRDHPQYVKQSSPTAIGIQPAQPGPSQTIGGIESLNQEELKKLVEATVRDVLKETQTNMPAPPQPNLKEAESDKPATQTAEEVANTAGTAVTPAKPTLPEALITPTNPQPTRVIPVEKAEAILPSLQAERSMSFGAQRFVQDVRRLIHEAKEGAKNG